MTKHKDSNKYCLNYTDMDYDKQNSQMIKTVRIKTKTQQINIIKSLFA